MLQAQGVEVVLAEEEEGGVGDGLGGGGIVAAIENRDLGDGAAWAVDGQYLFAATGGGLEDANGAGLNDVESRAGLGLGKNQLSRAELALHHARREEDKLRLGEAGEDSYPSEKR